MKSKRYQSLSDVGISYIDEESPRVQLIREQVTRYRSYAERAMLREFPDLQAIVRRKEIAHQALLQGVDPMAIEATLFPER